MSSTDEDIAIIKTKLDDQKEEIGHMQKTLYGNGRPGLVQDMSEVKAKVNVISRLLWGVITACIGILLKLFVG